MVMATIGFNFGAIFCVATTRFLIQRTGNNTIMNDDSNLKTVSDYWNREGLGQTILDYLVSSGKSLDSLTIEDLAPVDQFHTGGIAATIDLAALAKLGEKSQGAKVLDVGGGLGGPARTLAKQFGCEVTVIDLAETYVQAAEVLTKRIGLDDQVKHHVGDALDLPYDDGEFDVVWTQQSGMNIRDKKGLYEGFHRVLAPGGILAFQEFMAGMVQPLIFPVMWAANSSTSFLRTSGETRSLIEGLGFRELVWNEISAETSTAGGSQPEQCLPAMVMGDDLPAIMKSGKRNSAENRLVRVRAVFERR